MKRGWCLCVAVPVLAGCSLFNAEAPDIRALQPVAIADSGLDIARERAEVSALLAYYQDVQGLTAEEQKREHQAVGHGFARDRSELGRLKLALLMSLPQAPWRDDARLLALLEGAASRKAASDSPLRHFVGLLLKTTQERLREQKRAEELQLKLDSMVEIERRLRERKSRTR